MGRSPERCVDRNRGESDIWRAFPSPTPQRERTVGIAERLVVSVATVKSYVSRLLTKLDLDNRVQIALLVHDAE